MSIPLLEIGHLLPVDRIAECARVRGDKAERSIARAVGVGLPSLDHRGDPRKNFQPDENATAAIGRVPSFVT